MFHGKNRKSFCVRMALLTAIAFLFAGFAALAQPIVYQDFHKQWHVYDSAKQPKLTDAQLRKQGAVAFPATAISFTVIFDDVVNEVDFGFHDPVRGAVRRDTVMAVLSYMDSVLNENGACRIRFENSENLPDSSRLANAGPFFRLAHGFVDPFSFMHISTGIDPDGNPDSPDMVVTVNFGKNWNDGLGSPSGSQYDLFSVLLHELTHGLGFLSLTTSNGSSEFFASFGFRTFSRFDDLLYTGNGNKLWDAGGFFQGTPDWLRGTAGGVYFRGSWASSVYGGFLPIYAPVSWQEGSSISHWGQNLIPSPVMQYSTSAGIQRRVYAPFEIEALQDIGYRVIPKMELSSGVLDFGEQDVNAGPTDPGLFLIVENAGPGALYFDGAEIEENDVLRHFSINPSSSFAPMIAGAVRAIGVQFDPQTPGLKTATLVLYTNDPAMPRVEIALVGMGTGILQAAAKPEWILLE